MAYGSLVIMALIPIFLGSFRSVDSQKEQKENHVSEIHIWALLYLSFSQEKTGERPETMTQKDAMMFPIIASCALFGLYIFFHIFSKDYINLLLSFYFLVLGIFALSHMASPVVLKLVPSAVPVIPFHLKFTQGEGDSKEALMDYQFNTHDLVCLGLCSIVGVWYIMKKHWLANNLLGMAFAVNGNKE